MVGGFVATVTHVFVIEEVLLREENGGVGEVEWSREEDTREDEES